jgi:hypothetical protein
MEALMQRARLALGAGIPAPDVAARLIETGTTPEAAYLAVRAGEILLRDEGTVRHRQRMVTSPGIPSLKRG